MMFLHYFHFHFELSNSNSYCLSTETCKFTFICRFDFPLQEITLWGDASNKKMNAASFLSKKNKKRIIRLLNNVNSASIGKPLF
jgi:hypothetical protein